MAIEGAIRTSPADGEPKPLLVQLFEAAAVIMEVDEGQTSLELHFDRGHLRCWTARDSNNGHEAMRQYDERAPMLVELLRKP